MKTYGKGFADLQKDGKITVKDGSIICPVCGKGKLIERIKAESVIRHVDRKCKRCGCVTEVNYEAPEPEVIEPSA